MSPSVAPPFPFYIINKDIIKGSFPFRKTFLTPKLDFEARFRNPDFARPACPANLKSRNRTTKTEPIGGVRKSVQPKLDFAARFHSLISQLDFDRPACSADMKSRNRTTETEQTGGEGKFSSPENTPIQRLFYLCPRRLQNPITDIAVRSVRKSAFKPLRHRYCQVNPPAERLKNTHGNICNQVTSVDEFRCFSAFCA